MARTAAYQEHAAHVGRRRCAATMDILGVRFRPGGVGAFVTMPAHEVTDQVVTLDEVWGRGAGRRDAFVQDAGCSAAVGCPT